MPKKQKRSKLSKIGRYVVLPLILFLAIGTLIASFVNTKPKANQGYTAPGIELPDIEGQETSLQDLKGKIVLLDFWASWCKPCRKKSPLLRELYKEFNRANFKNADGFEIVSVSLDKKREVWLDAIETDSINWQHHLCDFQGWKSPSVESFEVTFLPSTFLINERGTIIGKNLPLSKIIEELKSRQKS